MSLKYGNFRLCWEKRLNSVYAKVSYLCAGLIRDKLTISPVIVICEK